MENLTLGPDLLLLEGLQVTSQASIPAFIFLFLIYVFVMLSNIALMVLITLEPSLHQPMYLLFCNLGANDALGVSAIVPRLLSDMLLSSPQRLISYSSCAIQAFCAHVYASASHTVLMIMAFDRYMAICNPLRYPSIMTGRMVLKLSVWAWAMVLLMVLVLVGLSVRLSRCRGFIANPFCDNASLFKLSCEDVTINNIYGLGYTVVLLGSSLGTITLTYLHIAVVCLRSWTRIGTGARNSQALQTCATHLILYIIMYMSGCIIIILHRFPELSDYRKMASIMFHVVPPAMNAVIYGLQIKAIRQKLLILFIRNR